MKKCLIVSVLLMTVITLSFSQTGNSWTVTNTSTWIDAVNGIRSGGNDKEYTITVTGTISVPASTSSTFGDVTSITVKIEGKGTLALSNNGNLLIVGDKQEVWAKDVTLRGRSNNGRYSVVVIMGEGGFVMEGDTSITGNTIIGGGGGVWLENGTFTMLSGTISGNTVTTNSDEHCYGGGVYVNDGRFAISGGTISGNVAKSSNRDAHPFGGGVHVGKGQFIMLGGTISNNASTYGGSASRVPYGGGVSVGHAGTFLMQDGTITRNTITTNTDARCYGSGVYNSGTFILQGGTISGNGNTVNVNGGGVYNGDGGTFIMENGSISGNTSSNGGGLCVPDGQYSGTFTMQGGTITGNTANVNGGGIYMGGLLTMQGNASVSGNTAGGNGGGICVIGYYYEERPFTMKDNVSVSRNTASGNGGGVCVMNSGIFTMQDNTSISGNTAIGNGGGLYLNGILTKTGGTIYGDDGDQNLKNTVIGGRGKAVYETTNGGWRNATAGLTMNPNSYGFWLNEGEAIAAKFPSSFSGVWKRTNFNNILTFTENTAKSSSSDYVWILTRISGNTYTMKRSDATNTITITISYRAGWSSYGTFYPATLGVSGDSGSGQNNWNGSWEKQ